MKRLILLLILSSASHTLFAQEKIYKHFKIEHNEIVWQKTIELGDSKGDYINQLKLTKFLTSLNWNANSTAGKTNKKDLRIPSPYWASFPFDCFAKIEFKEHKCRITFSNITFDGPEIELFGVEDEMEYKFSELALKNGTLKRSKKIYNIFSELNHFFEKVTYPNQKGQDSDW